MRHRMPCLVIALLYMALSACVGSTASSPGARPAPDPWAQKVVRAARWYLHQKPATPRHDCSGLVQAILARAGHSTKGDTRSFWHDAKRDGRLAPKPRPGYLAFFDRTYDANRNGRVDDNLTHVAIVVSVAEDGTVVMAHRGSGRIKELRMNVLHPAVRSRDGRILNDYLRAPGYGPRSGPRLTGQLLRGFAQPPR